MVVLVLVLVALVVLVVVVELGPKLELRLRLKLRMVTRMDGVCVWKRMEMRCGVLLLVAALVLPLLLLALPEVKMMSKIVVVTIEDAEERRSWWGVLRLRMRGRGLVVVPVEGMGVRRFRAAARASRVGGTLVIEMERGGLTRRFWFFGNRRSERLNMYIPMYKFDEDRIFDLTYLL